MSTAAAVAADFPVPLLGAVLCVTPAITRPTVQFGVRVPAEHAGAPVIGRQRRAYYRRTALIAVACTAAVLASRGHGSWWLPRIILLVEVAADLACLVLARNRITAVKQEERWFAGRRQTVVADTSWRADPPRFPLRWLIPALAVVAATIAVGVLRYPGLPARLALGLGTGGLARSRPKTVVGAFAVVGAQLYVTGLWSGMLVLFYRSRPDIEAADPIASAGQYRRFLATWARAMLALIALVDLTLLLVALQTWRVYQLSGPAAVLPLLPFLAGLLAFVAVALRAGQAGSRLAAPARRVPAGGRAGQPPGTDRDDDRFWKAGLIYVNRGDPALVVGVRFGVGWTLNYANPLAWLLIAGVAATPAGLAAIVAAAG